MNKDFQPHSPVVTRQLPNILESKENEDETRKKPNLANSFLRSK